MSTQYVLQAIFAGINSLKQDFNKDTLAVSLALHSNKLLQNIYLMMMFEFSSDLLVVIDTIDLRAEMTFSFERLSLSS